MWVAASANTVRLREALKKHTGRDLFVHYADRYEIESVSPTDPSRRIKKRLLSEDKVANTMVSMVAFYL